ncbi:hypothetical protein RDI58_004138 [Solanum bulbocastanum]|uniref:DUF4283 domain-containing protein n=1 Tax=Solanum bulbocastanum TaxID=147425 RepID=A0AAN8YLA6_SOLBU
MASSSSGQATGWAGYQIKTPTQLGETPLPTAGKVHYATLLKPVSMNMSNKNPLKPTPTIPIKPVTMLHGEPYIKWTEEEVAHMDVIENLQHAVVGKFSYGWPELDLFCKIIPAHCGIKGECQIGLFRSRHVLIRLTLLEDFVNLMLKPAYYISDKEGYTY